MSGIAGIIRFNDTPVEPGLVNKMTSSMSYRGPDGIHHWVKGSVAMGQCMLCTTPESLVENQPLTNEDETLVLVMDGRVDNWEALRKKLLGKGAVLRNRSDAELVLRSYEIWKEDCLSHIDGDFALVIWDARKQEAFCARDRMGTKPFNYHWDGNTLSFASELHAILALPWVANKINEGILAEFLAAEWYSQDETLWCEILRLGPAHQFVVSERKLLLKQYWEPDPWASLQYSKDEEYFEHYRELLTGSVRRLARSHKHVAIEVSGGLDSSAIFCLAEHLRCANVLGAPGVKGYTIAFTGDAKADELEYAQAVGEYLGVQINEIPPSRMPLSWLDERARAYSYFPGFANSNMAQNMLQKVSNEGSRVIMNGVGGDVWLNGSRSYYTEELANWRWNKLYNCFRADASVFGSNQAIKWFFRHGCFPLLPVSFQNKLRQQVGKLRGRTVTRDLFWLSPVMQEHIRLRKEKFSARRSQYELLQNWNDAYLGIANEEGEMRYSRFGLEVRQPLNTAEFVQFAFSTPERLRLRGDSYKYIHVQALQTLMPQVIINRRTKAEFSSMFREHLDQMEEVFTVNLALERSDWITKDGINKLFEQYKDNPHLGWTLWVLWSIYGCDRFLRQQEEVWY